MSGSSFVYVTYIRTTPEKLWDALTNPEFTKRYWYGSHHETNWKPGSEWKLMTSDGRVSDSGEILECDPPKRLVVSWRNELHPAAHAEGHSRCAFDIEPAGDVMKLTVTHEFETLGSNLYRGVSGGWPTILASLKSLLETGESLSFTRQRPNGV